MADSLAMHARHPLQALVTGVLVTVLATACAADETGQDESARTEDTSSTTDRATSSSPLPPVVPITPETPITTETPGPLIESAIWGDSELGPTLRVAPTPEGRSASGPEDALIAWQEVVNMAPDADLPGMWKQFDCHWTWARIAEPDKPTWNLEPWRPDADEETMIAERCNPGAPEV